MPAEEPERGVDLALGLGVVRGPDLRRDDRLRLAGCPASRPGSALRCRTWARSRRTWRPSRGRCPSHAAVRHRRRARRRSPTSPCRRPARHARRTIDVPWRGRYEDGVPRAQPAVATRSGWRSTSRHRGSTSSTTSTASTVSSHPATNPSRARHAASASVLRHGPSVDEGDVGPVLDTSPCGRLQLGDGLVQAAHRAVGIIDVQVGPVAGRPPAIRAGQTDDERLAVDGPADQLRHPPTVDDVVHERDVGVDAGGHDRIEAAADLVDQRRGRRREAHHDGLARSGHGRRSAGRCQPWSPSHDHRGSARSSGTSSAESW